MHASTQVDVAVELGLLSTHWPYTPKTSDAVEAFYYFLRTSTSPTAKRLYMVMRERFALVAVSKIRELRGIFAAARGPLHSAALAWPWLRFRSS